MRSAPWVLLLLLVAGCAPSSHVVRFRNASGSTWTYHPRSTPRPVEVSDQQLRETIRAAAPRLPKWDHPLEDAQRLFDLPPRSGNFLYEVRTRRLLPEDDNSPLDEVSIKKWVADYQAWCARTKLGTGDCLGILIKGRLTSHGRYVLALHMARREVLEATAEAARETGQPKAVLTVLATASGMYFVLWALPEPVSKGLAVVITVGLIGYLGFDTVVRLGVAFDQMVRESDQARDIGELQAAGERFGKVFGQNAARALITLAAAAIGQTGGLVLSKLPMPPGGSPGLVAALEEGGLSLAAAGEMEAVTVSAGNVSVSLASGSLAMAMAGGSPSMWTPPKEGPGEWAVENTSMPEFSRIYQSQVTGAPPGWKYKIQDVEFDGYENGVLIETKGRYVQFLEKGVRWPFDKMVKQATHQMDAARGARLRWVFAEREAADHVRRLFASRSVDPRLAHIEVVHVPPRVP
jgi:hypothetical protein